MRRNINNICLSNLERDILCSVEEAAAEELTPVLNGLADDGIEYSRRDSILDEFERSLNHLLRMGLVDLASHVVHQGASQWIPLPPNARQELFPLEGHLRWDDVSRYWRLSSQSSWKNVDITLDPKIEIR